MATLAQQWMQEAQQIGKQMDMWFAIDHGSAEHEAWAKYFRGLGFAPVTFKDLKPGKQWTAPCQWPEWLEAGRPTIQKPDLRVVKSPAEAMARLTAKPEAAE